MFVQLQQIEIPLQVFKLLKAPFMPRQGVTELGPLLNSPHDLNEQRNEVFKTMFQLCYSLLRLDFFIEGKHYEKSFHYISAILVNDVKLIPFQLYFLLCDFVGKRIQWSFADTLRSATARTRSSSRRSSVRSRSRYGGHALSGYGRLRYLLTLRCRTRSRYGCMLLRGTVGYSTCEYGSFG